MALYQVPHWPPYKVRSGDLQLVSFHSKKPYELKLCERNLLYNRPCDGYNMSYQGKRRFIGVDELLKIVEDNEKGFKMAFSSQKGGLKSGDLIIGSITKDRGAVSFSSDPAVHSIILLAKAEAARLATNDKTKKFIVVEVRAVASVNDVVWE